MIVKSYEGLAKLFVGENKDCVKINDDVKAFWTYNRERKETGIGVYFNGKCNITFFKDGTFELLREGF